MQKKIKQKRQRCAKLQEVLSVHYGYWLAPRLLNVLRCR